ncbi:hypothetical protein SmJEL517_g05470 [Synchytrium microbalum]|uniref:Phytase-like domain-containing protein n=1 Tax=Synchytrium microbalum TaxID=1806994 RepID=A0A507BVD4_9FUNG|nr:uncharacterized protein SmJEL517_g05470 [Synchytrium microbalum]TPX31131.1 hypothetical protein SmJEL517_g05470 [Synchytrium microbalum]
MAKVSSIKYVFGLILLLASITTSQTTNTTANSNTLATDQYLSSKVIFRNPPAEARYHDSDSLPANDDEPSNSGTIAVSAIAGCIFAIALLVAAITCLSNRGSRFCMRIQQGRRDDRDVRLTEDVTGLSGRAVNSSSSSAVCVHEMGVIEEEVLPSYSLIDQRKFGSGNMRTVQFFVAPDTQCSGTSIAGHLPAKFEPSDLAWDPKNQTLYVVSDNGKLAAVDVDGNLLHQWKVQKKLDLEGLTIVKNRTEFVYLGVEYPAEIIEFNIVEGLITRRWLIQDVFDQYPSTTTDQNAGLEALVYVPSPMSDGYMYAGRQADTKVFMFDIMPPYSSPSAPLKFRGIINPPGPSEDLSSMHVYKTTLFFVYDTAQRIVGVDLADPKWLPKATDEITVLDAKQETPLGILNTNIRGFEGFALTNKYAFLAVDAKDRKDLLRFSLAVFWSCFSSDGDGKVLAARSSWEEMQ